MSQLNFENCLIEIFKKKNAIPTEHLCKNFYKNEVDGWTWHQTRPRTKRQKPFSPSRSSTIKNWLHLIISQSFSPLSFSPNLCSFPFVSSLQCHHHHHHKCHPYYRCLLSPLRLTNPISLALSLLPSFIFLLSSSPSSPSPHFTVCTMLVSSHLNLMKWYRLHSLGIFWKSA